LDTRRGVDRALAAPEDGVRASVALEWCSEERGRLDHGARPGRVCARHPPVFPRRSRAHTHQRPLWTAYAAAFCHVEVGQVAVAAGGGVRLQLLWVDQPPAAFFLRLGSVSQRVRAEYCRGKSRTAGEWSWIDAATQPLPQCCIACSLMTTPVGPSACLLQKGWLNFIFTSSNITTIREMVKPQSSGRGGVCIF
jgi:hypothetical protein